jgi:aromatic-L-amino-acid/L-tryptophan decarboxylase
VTTPGLDRTSATDNTTGDLDLHEFRRLGHQVVDWIADYLANPQDYDVLPAVRPGEVRAALPQSPPQRAENPDTILEDFKRTIVPAMTHWNNPGFMAYFSSSGSTPGILGEMLTAALNVNAMLWRTSPAATELEEVTLEWLKQMLGLPEDFDGSLVDGASMANFLAVAAAREALDLGIREQGMSGRTGLPRLVMYTSAQAHSSMEKGGLTAGIGRENVRLIETDAEFRMDPAALAEAVQQDVAAGLMPFFVGATVGTTSSSSVDPLLPIAEVCENHNLWLHVDGAYGATAALLPEKSSILDGIDRADSFVVNPHKWMFTPIDCSAFFVRRPDILKRAFSLVPEYLRTVEAEGGSGVRDYMDYGVQLGRRFRALKLWMVIRSFGVEGLQARVREHIRLAGKLAGWIDTDEDFERLAPVPLSVVCFRCHPPSVEEEAALAELNSRLMDAVNASGKVFISHTSLNGKYSLRIQISQLRTTEGHVRRAWEIISAEARALCQ